MTEELIAEAQRLLLDAQQALEEYGKQEVSEVHLINRAYRDVLEAAAKLRAAGRIAERKAAENAEKGKDNPTLLELWAGFMAIYGILRSLADLGLYLAGKQ